MSRPLEAAPQFGMLRVQRAPCLKFKTVLNVLIARSSSSSDQAENAAFASSIEHVHNFTVIFPHRMQGMTCPPARQYVPQFEATATFRAIIKKIKKDYPDINQ